jgi:hypothetical protein
MQEVESKQTRLLPDHEAQHHTTMPSDWRVRCIVSTLRRPINAPLVTSARWSCLNCLHYLHCLMNVPLSYGTYLQLDLHAGGKQYKYLLSDSISVEELQLQK